jgi:predicted nucleic acid-binding protein
MRYFRQVASRMLFAVADGVRDIQKLKNVTLPMEELQRLTWALASGELSVVMLALDLGDLARVVIDEESAGREATALGLAVTGLGDVPFPLGEGKNLLGHGMVRFRVYPSGPDPSAL